MAIPTPPAAPLEPYVLADDPVLDMLNTLANIDGMPWDFWQTDADVQRWLVRLEWVQPAAMPAFEEGALLAAARELREVVRDLVATRKLGQVGNPTALNSFCARQSAIHSWSGRRPGRRCWSVNANRRRQSNFCRRLPKLQLIYWWPAISI